MDKKTLIIIILSLIIIILILIIFTGRNNFETTIEQIQGQRDSFARSTEIVKSENIRIREESAELKRNYIESEKNYIELESENQQYRNIINELTSGSEQTGKHLGEYGLINRDFEEFLRQTKDED